MSPSHPNPRRAGRLGLLVGSNPLPNFLAAGILEPREAVLLYSPETMEPRDRLRTALEQRQIRVEDVCIADATDARKIRDACHSLAVDHLHYSGGTKPMAAQARQSLRVGEPQASYLDQRRGLLRFDDGYEVRLDGCDLELTLDLVLQLHGIDRLPDSGSGMGTPTDGDVGAIARYVLDRPDAVEEFRRALRPGGGRRNITEAKGAPWTPPRELLLSVPVVPGADWTNEQYKRWDEFLMGGWLEQWTAMLIHDCVRATELDIALSVHCRRARPWPVEFEIDVALIQGHRLYVISCTTDRKKALCKSKLFEVAMGARQMGGDLARSALVCLLDGGDTKGAYVEQLRADISSLWDAPNVPKVFGLADLREWAGAMGEPNLTLLREWLES